MLPSFCTDTVAIVRPAKATERGSVVNDYANATRTEVAGCRWQQDGSTADTAGRMATMTTCTLYLPEGTDLAHDDRVELPDGTCWQVQGEPYHVKSPSGSISHVRATIARGRG